MGFGRLGGFYFHCFIYCFVSLFLGSQMATGATLVTGVRDHEEFVLGTMRQSLGRSYLPSEAKEFENGNTFVRLSSVTTGQKVEIWIPRELSTNTLMEALVKARIAHSEGAVKVTVVSPVPIEQVVCKAEEGGSLLLPLRELFAVAGTTHFMNRQNNYVSRPFPRIAPTAPWRTYRPVVAGETHAELRDLLGKTLEAPVIAADRLRRINSALVYYVSPAVAPVNSNFFRTLLQIRRLTGKSNSVILISPYLPYARSDKKDEPGVAITGRLAADLIEWAGTQAIAFVRAHAAQSEGFFSIPTFHISGRATISQALRELKVEVIESPDAGFQKDATLYAMELGIPVDVLNKQRDFRTGESRHHGGSSVPVEGKIVAVPDDESASGGTLGHAAEILKARGAKRVIGVVTHLTGDARKALENPALDLLIVTDTNPIRIPPHPKLKILSIEPELALQLSLIGRRLERDGGCPAQIASGY